MQLFMERIDKDLSLFKNYFDDQKKDKLPELFKRVNVEAKDFINDNEEELENDVKNYDKIRRFARDDIIRFDQPTHYSVDTQQLLVAEEVSDPKEGGKKVKKWLMPGVKTHLPTNTENPLKKTRGFSFEQLYYFNNLCMNKSFLRKRVRSLEVDLATAQAHIKELERWREELEGRMAENFNQVY